MAKSARARSSFQSVAWVAVAAAALALLFAPAAYADPLDEAKANGYIGERTDGTLGLVKSDAPADIKELVRSVNVKRQEIYLEIANKNGTTVAAVSALAGKKAIEKTLPGNYVQNDEGEWVKK